MARRMGRRAFLTLTAGLGAMLAAAPRVHAAGKSSLWSGFMAPPVETRPMVRWWWFGGAVEPDEIVREIKAMKAGGFGGFEIQPVYPLSLDDPERGIRNKPYLSRDFLEAIAVAARTGRAEGLRVDMTLGSGWPFGGPHITADKAAARLIKQEMPVAAKASSVSLPDLPEANHYLAAFVGSDAVAIGADHAVTFSPSDTPRTLSLVIQGRTGQQVKRPTLGSEGFVLDHMNPAAVRTHLDRVGEPLLKAFGEDRPYAIFSDSLEVYGANWTDDLLAEFKARRGYDLTPHLLSLFGDASETAVVRYDWGLTLSELVNERYLTPVRDWAKAHGTRFRSQTYGVPAVTLSSNARVDLAEGEGAEWRGFSSSRWASSANHIFGRPVTSAESWTWLHKGAFRATPLDIKAEADVLLLSGINQFIAHGWPYTPPKVPEPGWALYAAAVFNDHNPWWPVMGDVNLYLQRLSWLLRQGKNVADVAIYLPTEDVMASFRPGVDATINGQMRKRIPEELTASLLDAGYNFDFIDGDAILAKGIDYPVLILPHVERISPAAYERIQTYVNSGGAVIAVGAPPVLAPGFLTAKEGSPRVAAVSAALFGGGQARGVATDEAGLKVVLQKLSPPDIDGMVSGLGFVHRKLAEGDVYFVANTTNQLVSAPLRFRASGAAQAWNPVSEEVSAWRAGDVIRLAPYESRVFVFGDVAATTPVRGARTVPLSGSWTRQIGSAAPQPIEAFTSWADDAATAFFSGGAIYAREVDISAGDLAGGSVRLNLGESAPSAGSGRKGPGTQADLDAPVRDAAEVFVNGSRAGAIWCSPFELEIASFLKPGRNRLEIRVYNTAINLLAGRPPTDYGALNARFGERFKPQNMDDLTPLPSGLLKTPELRIRQSSAS